jgi:hypothetical protein
MRAARLGDDIDDFCVKCKRVMNHAVVSILNSEPAKVRCRTCHSDHDFRHEQAPPPKVDPRKAALFNQVLANVAGSGAVAPEAPAPAEAVAETVAELTLEPILEPPAEPVAAAVGDPPVGAKPKARKKAKA